MPSRRTTERKKISKNEERHVLGPCQRTKKKTVEHEADTDKSCNWQVWNCSQRMLKETEIVGSWMTNRNHPNYSIVEIDQNTEKSPGDFKRPAVKH